MLYNAAGGFAALVGIEVGLESLNMRAVASGGVKLSKSRSSFTDPTDGESLWLHRDVWSSVLDQRKRLKAVLNVLHGFARSGCSLSRSIGFGTVWEKVLSVGAVGSKLLTTWYGLFHDDVGRLYARLGDFFRDVVRDWWDSALRGWRNWTRSSYSSF